MAPRRDRHAGKPGTKSGRAKPRSAGSCEPGDRPGAGTSDVTVGELVSRVLAAGRARLVDHAARIPAGDDEDVHQARVATRQLRSLLLSFGGVLERSWVRGMRAELAWLGDALGARRDADVLTERLRDALVELEASIESEAQPGIDGGSTANVDPGSGAGAAVEAGGALGAGGAILLGRLAALRQEAIRALYQALEDPRYQAVLSQLASPRLSPSASRAARDVAPTWVRTAWRELAGAVSAFEDDPNDAALHQIRVVAKRLRYLCEAVAPVLGAPAADLGRAASRLQEVLGGLQDAVVAERWLDQAGAALAGPAAVTAGQLIERERQVQAARRREWRRRWKRVHAKRPAQWKGT